LGRNKKKLDFYRIIDNFKIKPSYSASKNTPKAGAAFVSGSCNRMKGSLEKRKGEHKGKQLNVH